MNRYKEAHSCRVSRNIQSVFKPTDVIDFFALVNKYEVSSEDYKDTVDNIKRFLEDDKFIENTKDTLTDSNRYYLQVPRLTLENINTTLPIIDRYTIFVMLYNPQSYPNLILDSKKIDIQMADFDITTHKDGIPFLIDDLTALSFKQSIMIALKTHPKILESLTCRYFVFTTQISRLDTDVEPVYQILHNTYFLVGVLVFDKNKWIPYIFYQGSWYDVTSTPKWVTLTVVLKSAREKGTKLFYSLTITEYMTGAECIILP